MNISYQWLKDYIALDLTPEQLEDRLTFSGIEVEKITETLASLKQLKVAKIVEKEKHPNAEKLSVCKVDDGSEELLQVVCGAPNCAAGQKIAFAPVGTKFEDFTIKKAKLRGVPSFGMICSEQELGLSDNHDGIMVLPEDAVVGQTLAQHLNIGDTVYEVEITPNRPDLLGMIGVARDLSSLLTLDVKEPELAEDAPGNDIQNYLTIENQTPELCPRYTARMIKGVTIKESPKWLQDRLLSAGLRPINNIVDVTNFVLMEIGHPIHAFDYKKLAGNKIIIRNANEKETIPALNDETYELRSSDLVIADAEKPVAIAGVIGGNNSNIDDTTIDVVIEAANFQYQSVRKTSNFFKITTDSCYRFERGMSSEVAEIASRRAIKLILDIAGGELVSGVIVNYEVKEVKAEVSVRLSRIKKVLTLDLTEKKVTEYLVALGLEKVGFDGDALTFLAPTHRKDLTREIDLLEEIIRLNGYNNVGTLLKPQNIMNRRSVFTRRDMEDVFVQNGFNQIMNLTFGDPEDLDRLNVHESDDRRKSVNIKNPLGSQSSIMRSMMLPSVLKTANYNLNYGQKDLKLFEINKVFQAGNGKFALENFQMTAICCGDFMPDYWKQKTSKVDFFDIKGVVEEILSHFSRMRIDYKPSKELFYADGQAADVFFNKKFVGSFGKLDAKILEKFDIDVPMFAIDFNLDKMINLSSHPEITFSAIPKFSPVLRDISFIIENNYSFKEIKNTILQANSKLIKNVWLMDEYKGKGIPAGKRSLTFSILILSDTKTLTDDAINKVLGNIFFKLEKIMKIEKR